MEGRSDKKFCSDQCRASYNNSQRSKSERMIQEVNKVLRKNRTLLKMLNPSGMSVLKKDFLNQNGFNFNYFTSRYKTKEGNEYWFCYDIGWMQLDDEKIRIIEYQSYMKK